MSEGDGSTSLLDSSVLVALVITEHEFHQRARSWATGAFAMALCSVVEGALFRYLLRIGESAATARNVLVAVRRVERLQFWDDDVSYLDVDLAGVYGHRQVTDAYLVSRADARGARLATLDQGLAATWPHIAQLLPR